MNDLRDDALVLYGRKTKFDKLMHSIETAHYGFDPYFWAPRITITGPLADTLNAYRDALTSRMSPLAELFWRMKLERAYFLDLLDTGE